MAEPIAADHVASLEEIKGYSGIEFLRRIADGRVAQPPICHTLGFRLTEVGPGFALFTMTPEFRQYNPIGSVHGGVAATLLELVHELLDPDPPGKRFGLHHAGTQSEYGTPDYRKDRADPGGGALIIRRSTLRDSRGQDHRCQRHLARPWHDDVSGLSAL